MSHNELNEFTPQPEPMDFQVTLLKAAELLEIYGPRLYANWPNKEDDNGRTSPDES